MTFDAHQSAYFTYQLSDCLPGSISSANSPIGGGGGATSNTTDNGTDSSGALDEQAAKDEILRLAASAEQSSDHPLSRAVLEAARSRGLVLHNLAEDAAVYYVGSGVKCDTASGVVLVGNRMLMEEQQVRK